MLKVRLENIIEPSKHKDSPYKFRHQYRVHTGTGEIKFFPSRNKAATWLRAYVKFLNLLIVDLNGMLIETFSLYRYAWPYMSERTKIDRSNENINMASDKLNIAVSCTGASAQHRIVSSISISSQCLTDVCIDSRAVFVKTNSYYQVHQAESLSKRLGDVNQRLEKYSDYEYP